MDYGLTEVLSNLHGLFWILDLKKISWFSAAIFVHILVQFRPETKASKLEGIGQFIKSPKKYPKSTSQSVVPRGPNPEIHSISSWDCPVSKNHPAIFGGTAMTSWKPTDMKMSQEFSGFKLQRCQHSPEIILPMSAFARDQVQWAAEFRFTSLRTRRRNCGFYCVCSRSIILFSTSSTANRI